MTTITLPFPPSTNNLFENRKGGRRRSDEYTAWLEEGVLRLAAQRPQPINGEVTVDIALRNPNNIARDADNRIKAVLDLLVKSGIIENDDHRYVRSVTARWVDAGEPCTVTISAIDRTSAFFKANEREMFAGMAPPKVRPSTDGGRG